jgi:hypothetical protein
MRLREILLTILALVSMAGPLFAHDLNDFTILKLGLSMQFVTEIQPAPVGPSLGHVVLADGSIIIAKPSDPLASDIILAKLNDDGTIEDLVRFPRVKNSGTPQEYVCPGNVNYDPVSGDLWMPCFQSVGDLFNHRTQYWKISGLPGIRLPGPPPR